MGEGQARTALMDAVCTETLETKQLENSFVQSREPQFLKRGEVRRSPPLNRPALTIPEARQRKWGGKAFRKSEYFR